MIGPPSAEPRYPTLTDMLTESEDSATSLFFVDRREQESEVPMTRVREQAMSIAAALLSRGVRRGDRVALALPTCSDFPGCFFGILCAGAIPVPLYPPVRLGKLDEYHVRTATMMRSVGAAMVITDERIRPFLGVAVRKAALRLGAVTVSDLNDGGTVQVDAAPGDIALIQFSSGTTHDPKPVALTHTNLLANLAAIGDYLAAEGTPNPVGVCWLPLYHDMGLIGNLLSAFYLAGSLVLIPPELFVALPAVWLRAISRHHGNYSAAPNFAFSLCVNRIRDEELDGVDLSSWNLCLNGAETVSAAGQRKFSERFARWGFDALSFAPCYGMAEASLAVTFRPVRRYFTTLRVDSETLASAGVVQPGDKELVGVGRPLAGVEVEIRDDDSLPVAADRVGDIVVRGTSVMPGYFNRADLTAETLHRGWLITGDRGFIHDDELFVCGRRKDTVIIRGANHAPQDFEEALNGLPGVRIGCAVAVGFVPDGQEEEALAMLVETTPDAAPGLADDVAARVLEYTNIAPAHVELLAPGTLPRTSSGKLRRGAARSQWLGGTLSAPTKVSAPRLMLHAARGQFSHVVAAHSRHNR